MLGALTLVASLSCEGSGADQAAQLFEENCAACHAVDGRGDPRQRGLNPGVDLTASELIKDGRNGLIYRRIAYGYGSMPGFSHKLDLEQMLELTDYTLNFNPERSAP